MVTFLYELTKAESLFYVDPHVGALVGWKDLHDGDGWCRSTLCKVANLLPCVHVTSAFVKR